MGGQIRYRLAALDALTGVTTGWSPYTDLSAFSEAFALAVSGSTVFAGGGFSSIGNLPHQGVACLYGSGVVGVPEPVADGVHEVAFTRLDPNPSRAGAVIEYVLPSPAHVRIRVHDLQGRVVARVVNGIRPAGTHQATWSGRGERGALQSGLYFVSVEAVGRRITKRLVLVR